MMHKVATMQNNFHYNLIFPSHSTFIFNNIFRIPSVPKGELFRKRRIKKAIHFLRENNFLFCCYFCYCYYNKQTHEMSSFMYIFAFKNKNEEINAILSEGTS